MLPVEYSCFSSKWSAWREDGFYGFFIVIGDCFLLLLDRYKISLGDRREGDSFPVFR